MTDQQKQTKSFFESHAPAWSNKASEKSLYNVIDARNSAALTTAINIKAKRLLDVGCGTGELVIDAAQRGIDATGIDFAAEMIAICKKNAAGVSKATFETLSFFDMKNTPNSYDLISAQGFIEYISEQEMEDFLARSAALLSPGGALAVGSRNRIFNAFSMNAYTKIEKNLGILPNLMEEAQILHAAKTQQDAIAGLEAVSRIDPQPNSHPDTGIGVSVRYQFSPAELIGRLKKHGFKTATIFPINFHGLPLNYATDFQGIANDLAKVVQRNSPEDHRLVPMCSSFVIDARLGL